jgi:hypothetical protein
MSCVTLRTSVAVPFLLLTLLPCLVAAQKTSGFPSISQRSYTGGSAKVTVKGTFTIDADVPLNTKASYSSGEVTWLQFGASGAAEPNSLITYGDTKEIGIQAGKGKQGATAGFFPDEEGQCSGTVEVTKTEVIGDYICKGVTSYEPGKGMGTVDIAVKFTAKS